MKKCPQCLGQAFLPNKNAEFTIRCRCGEVLGDSQEAPTMAQIGRVAMASPIGCRVDRWVVWSEKDKRIVTSLNYVRTWDRSMCHSDMIGPMRLDIEQSFRATAESRVRAERSRPRVFVVGSERFIDSIAKRMSLVNFYDDCASNVHDPWWSYRGRSSEYDLVIEVSHLYCDYLPIYRCFGSVSLGGDPSYVIVGGPGRPGIVSLMSGSACSMLFEHPCLVADDGEIG